MISAFRCAGNRDKHWQIRVKSNQTSSLPVWASFLCRPLPVAEKTEKSRPPSSCLCPGYQSLGHSDNNNKKSQKTNTDERHAFMFLLHFSNALAICPPAGSSSGRRQMDCITATFIIFFSLSFLRNIAQQIKSKAKR